MKLKILQIGAGGTGSWFARTLAQILCQYESKHSGLVNLTDWEIVDYDKVEKRNLIRQPFLGGVGLFKALYLADCLNPLLGINDIRPAARGTIELGKGRELSKHIVELATNTISSTTCLVVSCVDNTYTRQVMENTLATLRQSPELKPDRIWYVNMGVSAEGDWFAETVNTVKLIPTRYDTVTYPDGMLSCAVRAEMTPVPQTTYSNMMAGAMAAHMVNKIIAADLAGEEPVPMIGVAGKDFTSREISLQEYVQAHISDLVQVMEVPNNDNEDAGNGNDGRIETLNDD